MRPALSLGRDDQEGAGDKHQRSEDIDQHNISGWLDHKNLLINIIIL